MPAVRGVSAGVFRPVGILQRTAELIGVKPITSGLAGDVALRTWETSSPLTLATLEDLYGLASELHVTRSRAMKVATVAKGRRVIAGNIGRLQLRTMKGSTPAPTQMPLLLQPERDAPLASTLTWTADALMFYPRTWWIVQERDFYGWPIWVKLLPQEDAKTEPITGRLTHAWGAPVEARDVIQFDAPDAGLLCDGADTIRRAIVLNRAASLAEDNPVPALDIHNDGEDLDDDEIKDLLDSWQNARRTRGVGYSSKSVKVTPLGLNAEQLLIEGRKQITLELTRHLGIPAWAADAPVEGASLTYSNRASRNWELIDLALAPYMTAISGRLSMGDVTPRGWTATFNTDELTRDDQKTRFQTYLAGKNGGFVTNEMIAAWEGWDAPAPERTKA